MSGDSGPGRLAFRGFLAALWCAMVMVAPAALQLTWRSPSMPLLVAAFGAALTLGLPPLRMRRDQGLAAAEGTGPSPSALATGVLHGLFGAALFAPFALAFHGLALDGSVTALVAGCSIGLCGLAAAAGGSRASAGAGYGLVVILVAAAFAFGWMGPSLGSVLGSVLPWNAEGGPGAHAGGARVAGSALQRVALQLQGPLDQESIQVDGYPALQVTAELLPGESRGARAWMVGPESRLDWPETVEGENVTAQPVGGGYRCPDWAKRVGPPLSTASAGFQGGGVTALLAALSAAIGSIAVLRARQLPWAGRALALGLIGLAGAWAARSMAQGAALPPTGEQPLPIAVVEGRRLSDGGTEWVESRRSFGGGSQPASALDRAWEGQFELSDPRGASGTSVTLAGPGAGWGVFAPDASVALDWRAPFAAGMRILVPDVNTWGAFDAAWERNAAGEWISLGALGLGESPNQSAATPRSTESAAESPDGRAIEAPPPWCGQGLPQGGTLFLGRLGAPLEGTSTTWIRLSGFRSE